MLLTWAPVFCSQCVSKLTCNAACLEVQSLLELQTSWASGVRFQNKQNHPVVVFVGICFSKDLLDLGCKEGWKRAVRSQLHKRWIATCLFSDHRSVASLPWALLGNASCPAFTKQSSPPRWHSTADSVVCIGNVGRLYASKSLSTFCSRKQGGEGLPICNSTVTTTPAQQQ